MRVPPISLPGFLEKKDVVAFGIMENIPYGFGRNQSVAPDGRDGGV
jgi:hypothetical protein